MADFTFFAALRRAKLSAPFTITRAEWADLMQGADDLVKVVPKFGTPGVRMMGREVEWSVG